MITMNENIVNENTDCQALIHNNEDNDRSTNFFESQLYCRILKKFTSLLPNLSINCSM